MTPSDHLLLASEYLRLAKDEVHAAEGVLSPAQREEWGDTIENFEYRVGELEDEAEGFSDEL